MSWLFQVVAITAPSEPESSKGGKRSRLEHPLAKPEFDVVTGVSAGTLIAPFAFLGDAKSIDHLVSLFRNPHPDWVKKRGPLYFLPDNVSFAAIPGLEREVRRHITLDVVRRIAIAGGDDRILAVNTTNVDEGTSRVFNLVTEAQRAIESGSWSASATLSSLQQACLASSHFGS